MLRVTPRLPVTPPFAVTGSAIERWQLPLLVLGIALGGAVGVAWPATGARIGEALWPLLGLLLFATFLVLPVAGMRAALRRGRFLTALLAGNFIAVPLVVWALAALLPADPGLRLGFCLVLLAPCTDWYNTFTQLGRGDAALALASTPILLLAQMVLLPGLLVLVGGGAELRAGMTAAPFLRAFAGIILAPLVLALLVQGAARRRARLARVVAKAGLLPVPLLTLVLFVIAAASVRTVAGSARALLLAGGLFVAYLPVALALGLLSRRWLRLDAAEARTVTFSLGTRNSFVVLPLVLAWPGAGPVATAAVVLQSLVELAGMVAFVALVPRLVPDRGA